MVHKNGKPKANQTTTLQQKNDTNVSAASKLARKAAETPDNGDQAALEVVIQQQQITIVEMVVHIVKLEEHVKALDTFKCFYMFF